MTATRNLLGWITCLAATFAVFAAAAEAQPVMVIAGIIAAVAAIGWGLICYVGVEQPVTVGGQYGAPIEDGPAYVIGRDMFLGEYHYCDAYCDHWSFPGHADFEDEPLPYRAPVWPNEIGGVE